MKIYIQINKDQCVKYKEEIDILTRNIFDEIITLVLDKKFLLVNRLNFSLNQNEFITSNNCNVDFKDEYFNDKKHLTNKFTKILYEQKINQVIFTTKIFKSRLPKFKMEIIKTKQNLYEVKLLNMSKEFSKTIFWSKEQTFFTKDLALLIAKEINNIHFEKNSLRTIVKFYKDMQSKNEKEIDSEIILNKLSLTKEYKESNLIFIYWSMDDEVYTIDFILKEYQKGKEFILPVIEGDELALKRFTGIKDLKPGDYFGILEPEGDDFTEYDKIDLAIIPGVAFNDSGDRLGRGKGYYDKVLNNLSSKTPLIGLGFTFQIFEQIPTEIHDKKLNLIITNSERKNEN